MSSSSRILRSSSRSPARSAASVSSPSRRRSASGRFATPKRSGTGGPGAAPARPRARRRERSDALDLPAAACRHRGVDGVARAVERPRDRLRRALRLAPGTQLSELGGFDLVVEAAGDAQLMADTLGLLRRSGVACLFGIDPRAQRVELDGRTLALDAILENRVLFGSVNAAPRGLARGGRRPRPRTQAVAGRAGAVRQPPGAARPFRGCLRPRGRQGDTTSSRTEDQFASLVQGYADQVQIAMWTRSPVSPKQTIASPTSDAQ